MNNLNTKGKKYQDIRKNKQIPSKYAYRVWSRTGQAFNSEARVESDCSMCASRTPLQLCGYRKLLGVEALPNRKWEQSIALKPGASSHADVTREPLHALGPPSGWCGFPECLGQEDDEEYKGCVTDRPMENIIHVLQIPNIKLLTFIVVSHIYVQSTGFLCLTKIWILDIQKSQKTLNGGYITSVWREIKYFLSFIQGCHTFS